MSILRLKQVILFVFICAAMSACKKPESATSTPGEEEAGGQIKELAAGESGDEQAEDEGPSCPMAVSGTTPEAVKLEDAVGIEYRTTGDVELLRELVAKEARDEQRNAVEPGKQTEPSKKLLERMNEGQRERYMKRFEQRVLRRTAAISAEELEDGMRIRFKPADQADLDKLFDQVEEATRRLIAGGERCVGEMRQRMRRDAVMKMRHRNPNQADKKSTNSRPVKPHKLKPSKKQMRLKQTGE